MTLNDTKIRALDGIPATIDEALALNEHCTTDDLCNAANEVRIKWCGDTIDTCSIANARSGRCSEDCKWCAQSRFHNTEINEYDVIPQKQVLQAVKINSSQKVQRFSLVTSGRHVTARHLTKFCDIYRDVAKISDISLCASMGLLGREELQMLKDAGVKRYHCNLEASASYFPKLCSTHTHEDKLRTIALAREIGMEICCGGIIGMGETMRQRLELVEEARNAHAVSIPINILQPIKGTSLEQTPLISEEEIIRTVALSRFIAPKATLRFAGGRIRLSRQTVLRILRGGMNGALVGDMLTTIGNKMDEDHTLFAEAGFKE